MLKIKAMVTSARKAEDQSTTPKPTTPKPTTKPLRTYAPKDIVRVQKRLESLREQKKDIELAGRR